MIKTGKELAAACKEVAEHCKTLYVMGCFGAPMTDNNKERYIKHHSYNQQPDRKTMIKNATSDTFGFDCVCLIKALLWGWNGNTKSVYGGAVYNSNGVPDISADQMIRVCSEVSTDFTNIEVGEAVWGPGHIGIYIGGGLAVECTPAWNNNVQITAVHNMSTKSGYNGRTWQSHGKLPYVDYVVETVENSPEPAPKSVDELAREVIAGEWGNGAVRKIRLSAAGHDYNAIQKRVDELLSDLKPAPKSVDELAREVIAGKWGNGAVRKTRLSAAGHDYNAIQKRVNELKK